MLEMVLINCEINLNLNWSEKSENRVYCCRKSRSNIFNTDTKLYVPVVTLLTQNNAKLLEQLESSFKSTINWNKYQSKISAERPNKYLDYLIDSSFQEVNRRFVLSLEDEAQKTSYKGCYLPTVELKNYNAMFYGQNFFDQPVRNN